MRGRRWRSSSALADLGGVWDVESVTAALTDFADAALGAAVRLILDGSRRRRAARARQTPPTRTRTRGWIILGMGKFGARELNYSSDIDLIVLYDPSASGSRPRRSRPSVSSG